MWTLSLRHTSSVVVVRRLSYPVACDILVPRSGIEPVSPALEGEFFTTGSLGRQEWEKAAGINWGERVPWGLALVGQQECKLWEGVNASSWTDSPPALVHPRWRQAGLRGWNSKEDAAFSPGSGRICEWKDCRAGTAGEVRRPSNPCGWAHRWSKGPGFRTLKLKGRNQGLAGQGWGLGSDVWED